jgi:hypothetical protein
MRLGAFRGSAGRLGCSPKNADELSAGASFGTFRRLALRRSAPRLPDAAHSPDRDQFPLTMSGYGGCGCTPRPRTRFW